MSELLHVLIDVKCVGDDVSQAGVLGVTFIFNHADSSSEITSIRVCGIWLGNGGNGGITIIRLDCRLLRLCNWCVLL